MQDAWKWFAEQLHDDLTFTTRGATFIVTSVGEQGYHRKGQTSLSCGPMAVVVGSRPSGSV